MPIRVTVWNENRPKPGAEHLPVIYPDGIHGAVAGFLEKAGMEVRTSTLDEPEHGLSEEILSQTDVLVYWGHIAHADLSDEAAARIQRHVLGGMGFVPLHSAHFSKPFKLLMGTGCTLRWRVSGDHEVLWCVNPAHPIAQGIPPHIHIGKEEMYGEHFDIPAPDELVFIGWFSGGEVFRSGICYNRGRGRIFYFQPGHETYPVFHQPEIQSIITNAVRWAAGDPHTAGEAACPRTEPVVGENI